MVSKKVMPAIKIKGSGNAKFEVLGCPFCRANVTNLGDPQGADTQGYTLIPCLKCGEEFFVLTGKEMTFNRKFGAECSLPCLPGS